MPLVAHTELPTFERMKQEGQNVLPRDYALQQDIRELHVGLLNMMPDAALEATERQFFRLIGESKQLAIYMQERALDYVAQIDPDDFVRWVFSRLFRARVPRYEAIARQYGYTITTAELAQVQSEGDFLALIERAIARQE